MKFNFKRHVTETIAAILMFAVVVVGSVKIAGNTTNTDLEVDTTSKAARVTLYDTSGNAVNIDGDKNLQVAVRPAALGSLGAYSLAVKTGSLAATIGAGSTLFSARWTDSTRLALIEHVRIDATTNGTITTSVAVDFELVIARSFTASDTGGTSVLPAANNNERRTSFGTTLFGDMRIASTAALGTGTRTVDASAVGRSNFGISGTTAPNNWFGNGNSPDLWNTYLSGGAQYPIVLKQDEGILIRNVSVGPATGTWVLSVNIDWQEVSAY